MVRIKSLSLSAIVLFAGAAIAQADWNGPTSGTANYLDPANWVANNINDDIDNFTLTGDLTLTFNANHATVSGTADWSPLSSASNYDLNLISNGSGPHTITLQGDVAVNNGGNASSNILHLTIGSTTVGEELSLSLGGVTRNFNIGNHDILDIVQPLVNAGAGFTMNGGPSQQLILRADSSAGLSGTVTTSGTTILFHEKGLGTADFELASNGSSLNLSNLPDGFNIANNITSLDSVGSNANSINAGTTRDGQISGNVLVGPGRELNFGAENDTGNGLIISGNLSVGAGGVVSVANDSDLILTGDANVLAGNLRVGPNGGARLLLGAAGDPAFLTVDINDSSGDYGSFGNFANNDGTLQIVNAVLNFDTTDVSPMSQSWNIIDTDLISGSTFDGLGLELDGFAFTETSGVWTASNAIGNWTFTEATGQLAFMFVAAQSQPVPEPATLAIWSLLGIALFWLKVGRARREV